LEALAEPSPASPVTGIEYSPLAIGAPVDETSAPLSANHTWSVGTLIYNRRGLIWLFVVLLGGDFAYSFRERSVGTVVQLMLKRLHASDMTTAILFTTLPTLLSLIISPLISYQSDRLRSRWGRRIPFLILSTPVAAMAMFGIAFTDQLGGHLHALLGAHAMSQDQCALACFSVLWTIFEIAAMVAGAVLGGLINDVVPREVLGRFYGLFRQVSLGVGIIFNYWVISNAETHFKAIFLGVAAVFFVGFTWMCLNVREGRYPPPPRQEHATGRRLSRMWTSTRTYFVESFSHRYYWLLYLGLMLASATFLPFNLFSIYYAKDLHVPLGSYGKMLAFSYFISFFLASPLGWIVDKAHTLRVSLITLGSYAVLMTVLLFTVHDARTFDIALVLHTVLSGCYWTVSSSLSQALFPRLSYAQYASACGIVSSLFMIGFSPALGRLLDATHHDYRLTFLVAGVAGFAAVVILLVVYLDFLRLGGPANYVAPE
jgi:MFS family permease